MMRMETFQRQTPVGSTQYERGGMNWAIWLVGMVMTALIILLFVFIALVQNGAFGGPAAAIAPFVG